MMILLSFLNLFRNTRRTAAILLTIALGTGVLFSFKGFIHGVLGNYRESTIHSHYGHGQINTKNYRETVYNKPWEHWITNQAEVDEFLNSNKAVTHLFPRISFSALLKKGHVSISGLGQGIEASNEASFFSSLNVEQGVTLSDQENGLLLGKGLAKALDLSPGDSLTLMVNAVDGTMSSEEFIVSGIFHTGSLDFDSRIFRVQLKKAQSLLKTDCIESISLGLKSHTDWDHFASLFEKRFPELETTSFEELDRVYYKHSVDWLNAQFKVVQIIILSIVLLGIFNSVSAAILERKQEIGNFRANGESSSDILRLIVIEGVFLGLIGSIFGIAVTYLFLKGFLDKGILMPPGPGLTRSFYISFNFDWAMVYTTLAFALVSVVLASFFAGLKVAKMPIAKALRSY